MKYLSTFKLFESNEELTLYHGGFDDYKDEDFEYNKFKEFHEKTSYFSDKPRFAIDYAYTKSQDNALDADILLYICKFTGNLFNYKNKEDLDKLIPLIPEKVKVNHGTAWFLDHEFSKEEMIKALQGIQIIYPIDYIANAEIGDLVPDPSYKSDKMIVINKDDDNVYTMMERTYKDYLSASSNGYDKHFNQYTKYKDIFEEWRNSIVDLYNLKTGKKYPYPKYDSFKDFFHTYHYATTGYNINYVCRGDNFEVNKEDIEKIDSIYKKCFDKFDIEIKKDASTKDWTRKVIDVPMNDFWNYYENKTIMELIKKLGYDAYIALEDGHNTYAVFEPNKTIKIVDIKRV